MNELALFAGAGGGILGGKLLGWRTVCAVEREPYAASVLIARQNEGILAPFPIWDNVCTFDGKPWCGIVDVVSGGFPCQDISSAGKGAGIDGERSGLWYEMLRIIGEVVPKYAFIENSPNLRSKGLVTILQGLDKIGYNAAWDIISAKEHGANHERKRMWILAEQRNRDVSNTYVPQCERGGIPCGRQKKNTYPGMETWWKTSSAPDRVDDGVAARMDRLKAIGNGQVPLVAASAFCRLKQQLDN